MDPRRGEALAWELAHVTDIYNDEFVYILEFTAACVGGRVRVIPFSLKGSILAPLRHGINSTQNGQII